MNVILCADDRDGLMFGGRRQSRDRAVIEDIGDLTQGCRFLMNRYSDKMFGKYGSENHETFEDTEEMLNADADVSPERRAADVSRFSGGAETKKRRFHIWDLR